MSFDSNQDINNHEFSDEELKEIVWFSIRLKTLAKVNNQKLQTAFAKCLCWYFNYSKDNEKNNTEQSSKIQKNVSSHASNYSFYPDAFCKKDEFDEETNSIINKIKKIVDEDT